MQVIISQLLGISEKSVKNTLSLFAEGATVPFIARYRKEVTGNLNEIQIRSIQDKQKYLIEINERKQTILNTIADQRLLTNKIKKTINDTLSKTELEDIYLPFKPKRKTKAKIAEEKGLLPLADRILRQKDFSGKISDIIPPFLNENVPDIESALQGASDIIAEKINMDTYLRKTLRNLFFKEGKIKSTVSKTKKNKPSKFEMYYDFEESAASIPSHRFLAIMRGENEKILTVKWIIPEEKFLNIISDKYIYSTNNIFYTTIKKAVEDSFKRLLYPSLSSDIKKMLKEKSDEEAVKTFAKNLRQLLLASPLGTKPIIALDPGFRTGIKLVVLDATGKPLHNTAIYPIAPHNKKEDSSAVLNKLIEKFSIKYIALGNGTASRETEAFINEYKNIFGKKNIACIVVNEAGASIYSVSDTAGEEFLDYDATVRGAISIGRRLQDPLAELVKIDPKSIGVGQYQHDVNQTLLKQKLDEEVEHCVNLVGVDVNTASKALLSYVAGIGKSLAAEIVSYRNKHGKFQNRKQFLKIPKYGKKAFEQSAGFLRIKAGNNPLDSSAIHPETYSIVEKILSDLKTDIKTVMGNDRLIESINIKKYFTSNFAEQTLKDIISELKKPGLDPRTQYSPIEFDDNIRTISDLKEGMVLTGIITNITNFGAFVDLGVHKDALVHISHLADKFVKDPCDIVKVGQQVKAKVLSVDAGRKRIALSLKGL
ncbi:RNA-binding transcriptional accessory protein [bacterium]|nr:RNA-binding transcriptional accessory protein [bacterium]